MFWRFTGAGTWQLFGILYLKNVLIFWNDRVIGVGKKVSCIGDGGLKICLLSRGGPWTFFTITEHFNSPPVGVVNNSLKPLLMYDIFFFKCKKRLAWLISSFESWWTAVHIEWSKCLWARVVQINYLCLLQMIDYTIKHPSPQLPQPQRYPSTNCKFNPQTLYLSP